jgi:hypothetical protein
MAATNADVIAAQKEVIRPKLQDLIETATGVGALFKRAGESFKVSTWTQALSGGQTLGGFRVPLKQWNGGDWGVVNYDEGDLGSGSSMKLVFMTGAVLTRRLAVELSQLEMDATASNEQAVANIFKEQTKVTIKEVQGYFDTDCHGSGNGVLAVGNGTGTSGNINPIYNLEPNFGTQRLRYNQPIDVYDTTLATKKGTLRVATLDPVAKTVGLTGTVTGAGFVNTDALAITGMSPTLATGSYASGMYTYQNSAKSGFTLNLDRSVVVEIVTPNVAAASQPLNPNFGLLLKDQITQRRDQEEMGSFRGIAHMAQRAAWYNIGIGISEWQRGTKDKMIDVMPSDTDYNTTFEMTGVTHIISKKQDRSRIDWVNPKTWARILLFEPKWHESPEGKRYFEVRSQTTGNVVAGWQEFMIVSENLVSCDPGLGGFISGLQIAPGY